MNYGFVRTAGISLPVEVANCSANSRHIIDAIRHYDKKLQFIVFPELCITGYTCADLFFQKTLQKNAISSLIEILSRTKYTSVIAMVGMPLIFNGKLFNCAVVIQSGKVLGVVPKSYLPNYSEYYEKRWFAPGKGLSAEIELAGMKIPFGTDIILLQVILRNVHLLLRYVKIYGQHLHLAQHTVRQERNLFLICQQVMI